MADRFSVGEPSCAPSAPPAVLVARRRLMNAAQYQQHIVLNVVNNTRCHAAQRKIQYARPWVPTMTRSTPPSSASPARCCDSRRRSSILRVI
ncbi:hypothetical protein RHECNPAF_122100111 [Rhizobium etli CNPAF512]|nr:hypothetical protein RHECNPAF_122100111 [Rhizobium etli CNPAF512]